MIDEFGCWLQDRFEELGDAVVTIVMWATALWFAGGALLCLLYGAVWVIGAVAGVIL